MSAKALFLCLISVILLTAGLLWIQRDALTMAYEPMNGQQSMNEKLKSHITRRQSGLKLPELNELRKTIDAFEQQLAEKNLDETAKSHSPSKVLSKGNQNWSYLNTPADLDLGHTLVRNDNGKLFIQAPHQFGDRLSGEISLLAMQLSNSTNAIFLNAQHRKHLDYSRLNESILTQLTQSYIREHTATSPAPTIVQLHGFDSGKRRTELTQQANFIISSGSKRSLALPLALKRCLNDHGFINVMVYGDDSNELGATQNPVKKRLYQLGHRRFLHIEMSLVQRKELNNDLKAVAQFYQCLDTIAETVS